MGVRYQLSLGASVVRLRVLSVARTQGRIFCATSPTSWRLSRVARAIRKLSTRIQNGGLCLPSLSQTPLFPFSFAQTGAAVSDIKSRRLGPCGQSVRSMHLGWPALITAPTGNHAIATSRRPRFVSLVSRSCLGAQALGEEVSPIFCGPCRELRRNFQLHRRTEGQVNLA